MSCPWTTLVTQRTVGSGEDEAHHDNTGWV
jgi:hypothetical protein